MIAINLKPSWILLGLLAVISIVSCTMLLILSMHWLFKLSLILLVLSTTVFYVCRDGLLLLPQSWQQLEVSSKGELRLRNRQGQQFTPILSATSFIHPLLVILNFEQPSLKQWRFNNRLPAVVLISGVNDDQHRKLRVWLRWWKHAH